MSDSFIKLPFPPSIWKAYYRRGVSSIKTKEYRAFESAVAAVLSKAKFKIPDVDELEIQIILFSDKWRNKDKTVKKRDLDNYLKCLIDSIVKYIRNSNPDFDDSAIFSLFACKKEGKEEFTLMSLKARHPRDYK